MQLERKEATDKEREEMAKQLALARANLSSAESEIARKKNDLLIQQTELRKTREMAAKRARAMAVQIASLVQQLDKLESTCIELTSKEKVTMEKIEALQRELAQTKRNHSNLEVKMVSLGGYLLSLSPSLSFSFSLSLSPLLLFPCFSSSPVSPLSLSPPLTVFVTNTRFLTLLFSTHRMRPSKIKGVTFSLRLLVTKHQYETINPFYLKTLLSSRKTPFSVRVWRNTKGGQRKHKKKSDNR